ncbi:MAG: hypothetical protein WC725_05030 [Patescibacteria group bacterium]|jgi:hypothetical protein
MEWLAYFALFSGFVAGYIFTISFLSIKNSINAKNIYLLYTKHIPNSFIEIDQRVNKTFRYTKWFHSQNAALSWLNKNRKSILDFKLIVYDKNNLPNIEQVLQPPLQDWTPAEHISPETSGNYLVTTKLSNDEFETGILFYSAEKKQWLNTCGVEILAWQPKPKAYQPPKDK